MGFLEEQHNYIGDLKKRVIQTEKDIAYLNAIYKKLIKQVKEIKKQLKLVSDLQY
jgi:hypothetical protein